MTYFVTVSLQLLTPFTHLFPQDFPGCSDGKVCAPNVGDLGSIPGSGRSPGGGNGNLVRYSCLENPMDRGAWWDAVHGVAKSQTPLSSFQYPGNTFQCLPELQEGRGWSYLSD